MVSDEEGHGESCVALGDEGEDKMVAACWDSQEQLERHLVTMTSLPESRWRNLFNLDVIKVTGFSALTCSSPYKLSPYQLSP